MYTKKLIFISIIICIFSQIGFGQYKEFMYDGIIRQYAVYEPSLEPNPDGYPLLIGLHGTSADGVIMIAVTDLVLKANKEKFIVACPNGLNYGRYTYFNAGGGYEEKTDGTDDLGFISALIDTMIENYNVDPTRVYVMGFSNGAMMSYRLAAEISHKIAAIGAVSGSMLLESCNPEHPVPIIHLHGLIDNSVPYEGGIRLDITFPPVDSTIAIWREINNCSSIPDTIYNSSGIIGQKWTSSGGDGDIELYTIEDWGHEWPHLQTAGIEATDYIWDFLKVQNRIIVTNIEEDDTQSIPKNFTLYQNYPNPFNSTTAIKYDLSEASQVVLKIYNLWGQEIRTLVNENQQAGLKFITWNGLNEMGRKASSGIYIYQIKTPAFSISKKMILVQ